ncbi:MAG: sulfotransferase domain-containing protein, partial [Chloroflexaceae bacterium]|nr:sulfotransferase domain-containing protein [Chloroflexaceae bacterium]
MSYPDFLIVGAPKCGTTAMWHYLRQHPQIVMPDFKEPHFFGSDLPIQRSITSPDAYQALFQPASGQICGESSTWYLYSQTAAREIQSINPHARIIAMLRNPIDFMYSLHNQALHEGVENIDDFAIALAAEPDRKVGKRLPPRYVPLQELLYSEVAHFSTQVQRYLGVFGPEQVHLIIYDDFQRHTGRVFQQTLAFLGVDDTFQTEFLIVNASKQPRSKTMRSLITCPPAPVRTIARATMPQPFRQWLQATMNRLNTRYQPRPPMDAELRRRLQQQFAPEVAQLGALLGRDLSHWSNA